MGAPQQCFSLLLVANWNLRWFCANCHLASFSWHLTWNTLKSSYPCIKQRWNKILQNLVFFETRKAAKTLRSSRTLVLDPMDPQKYQKFQVECNCCNKLLWKWICKFRRNQDLSFARFCWFWTRIHPTQDPWVNGISTKNNIFQKFMFFCDELYVSLYQLILLLF